MAIFLLNIFLAVAWAALMGEFNAANLIFGLVLGAVGIWFGQFILNTHSYFTKLRQIVEFVLLFTWELVKANFRVAMSVVSPNSSLQAGIVAIPLDLKTDVGIMILANMITLTPGTLSVDVSDDQTVLYVHGMHIDDSESFKREIKNGFERKVREVFE